MMKRFFVLFLISFFSFTVTSMAESKANSIKELWSSLKMQNDNEKNFRFSFFIDSLLILSNDIKPENINNNLPSDWDFGVSDDSLVYVMAGVLPYSSLDPTLIYVINHDKQYFLFYKKIKSSGGLDFKPKVEIVDEKFEGSNFYSLNIRLNNEIVENLPDIMIKIFFDMIVKSKNDKEKDDLSEMIWHRLAILLQDSKYYQSSFEGFDRMSTLISKDGIIKLLSWNIEYFNGDNVFHGSLVINNNDSVIVYRLIDQHYSIDKPEEVKLDNEKWFGCVYYDIIENNLDGKKIYTLLGYNPHDAFTKIRVIETLMLNENMKPEFGISVFDDKHRSHKRLIFEYSIRANMMLRYDPDHKMIIMDNLSSFNPLYQDDPRFIGPDFSHNGLKFENEKWKFYDDIDIRNP